MLASSGNFQALSHGFLVPFHSPPSTILISPSPIDISFEPRHTRPQIVSRYSHSHDSFRLVRLQPLSEARTAPLHWSQEADHQNPTPFSNPPISQSSLSSPLSSKIKSVLLLLSSSRLPRPCDLLQLATLLAQTLTRASFVLCPKASFNTN